MAAHIRFKDLAIGQRFDFIAPKSEQSAFSYNSFFDRCVKTGGRKYRSIDRKMPAMNIGTINCRVYHVTGP